MSRIAVLVAVLVVAVAFAGSGSTAVTKLAGTTGPGFTITLKKGSRAVKTLSAGRYTFVVNDRSDMHNFWLKGPGVNREITGVDFQGRKTVTLRLRKGRYTYVCTPHASTMKGSFRVT